MDIIEKKGFISMQLQLTEINKNLKTQKFSTGLYTFSTKNLLKKLKHKQSYETRVPKWLTWIE